MTYIILMLNYEAQKTAAQLLKLYSPGIIIHCKKRHFRYCTKKTDTTLNSCIAAPFRKWPFRGRAVTPAATYVNFFICP
jgi:hypothetical protein